MAVTTIVDQGRISPVREMPKTEEHSLVTKRIEKLAGKIFTVPANQNQKAIVKAQITELALDPHNFHVSERALIVGILTTLAVIIVVTTLTGIGIIPGGPLPGFAIFAEILGGIVVGTPLIAGGFYLMARHMFPKSAEIEDLEALFRDYLKDLDFEHFDRDQKISLNLKQMSAFLVLYKSLCEKIRELGYTRDSEIRMDLEKEIREIKTDMHKFLQAINDNDQVEQREKAELNRVLAQGYQRQIELTSMRNPQTSI